MASANKDFGIRLKVGGSDRVPPGVEMPDAKCNQVALVKTEGIPAECRHFVGVSGNYICYIVKGTLMRVIHTIHSAKLLLRGHENYIMDTKFSPCSDGLMCTVDHGSVGQHHVFIWQLNYEAPEILTHDLKHAFKVQASFVLAHPTNPSLWIIGHERWVAVLDTSNAAQCESDKLATTYHELSNHVMLHSSMTGAGDVSFSPAGDALLIGSTQEYSIISHTDGKLAIAQRSEAPFVKRMLCSYSAVTGGGCDGTVVEVSVSEASPTEVELDFRVAAVGDGRTLQQFSLAFPRVEGVALGSVPVGDVSLCVDHWTSYGRVVVVSHRCSKFVACVRTAAALRDPRPRPLQYCSHVTFADLHYPPLYPVSVIISGEEFHGDNASSDHSNAEDGFSSAVDHLEVSCCQILNKQSAIQQYHLLIKDVIGNEVEGEPAVIEGVAPPPAAAPARANAVATNALASMLLGPMANKEAPPAPEPVPAAVPAATKSPVVAVGATNALSSMLLGSKAAKAEPAVEKPKTVPTPEPTPEPVPAAVPAATKSPVPTPVLTKAPIDSATVSKPAEVVVVATTSKPASEEKEVTKKLEPVKTNAPKVVAGTPEISPASVYLQSMKKNRSVKTAVPTSPQRADSANNSSVTVDIPNAAASGPTRRAVAEPSTLPEGTEAAFRGVVENCLLPAFQDSVGEMLQQVQGAFESGIAQMISRNNEYYQKQLEAYVKQSQAQHTMAMQRLQQQMALEMGQLRKEVDESAQHQATQMKNLEQFLGDLHGKVARLPQDQGAEQTRLMQSIQQQLTGITEYIQGGGGLASPARPIPLALYEDNPTTLLSQGRLMEALEVVLEGKDIKIVSRLLARSSQSELNDVNCKLSQSGEWDDHHTLVLLCLAQQLLADILTNPNYTARGGHKAITDRVEWLKAVIMIIVKALPKVGPSNSEASFTILSSIGMDLKDMQKKMHVEGAGMPAPSHFVSIPTSSIQSDIQMLSYIVDNFRR